MKPPRKHIITLLFAVFSFSQALAQLHGNEWIEYNLTYYKFNVTRTGLHRISLSALTSVPGVNLTTNPVRGDKFNLFRLGEPVPYYFFDIDGGGYFDDPGDYIEFYGKPNDGTFDTRLYPNPAHQPNSQVSMFSDTAVYFLTWNAVKPNILIEDTPNNLTNLPAKEQYYMKTVRINGAGEPQPGFPIPIGGGGVTYESIFDEGEGFGFATFTNDPLKPYGRVDNILAPDVYAAAPVGATVNFTLISINSQQHKLDYKFNQLTLGSDQFNGFRMARHSYPIPLNSLVASNTLNITASYSSSDRNALVYAELIYPSQVRFGNASRANFTLNAGDDNRYLEVINFDHRNTNPILYDLTNNLRIVGTQALKFHLPAQSEDTTRELFLSSQFSTLSGNANADIVYVGGFTPVSFINYFDQSVHAGDYLILTHTRFITDGNNYPDKYKKYRESANGGNYSVKIIDVNTLYDQFSYGIKKHPLAIRNFIDFALENWTLKPEYLFIIGKGREYWQQVGGSFKTVKSDPVAHSQCLVPTFGTPGSDVLLTATNASITPRVAVGRLSVEIPEEIDYYLQKVMAFERLQREVGNPYQTIEGKVPMKRIMHMAGGADAVQQQRIANWLESYEGIIEDTLFGGDVYTFKKTSSDPIEIVQSEYIRELINTGVTLITFFGHSSASSFDFSVDDPDNFGNFERYPVILSNGCFTGNIYNSAPGISEDFVLTPNKAAIAFISTIGLSSEGGLNNYSYNFYQNMGRQHYGSSLGHLMQKTTQDIEIGAGTAANRSIAEEMTLHGDPALPMNPHAKPDYALEAQNVSFIPSTVTVSDETFQVRVINVNLGKAIKDSIDISLTRYLPGGDAGFEYTKRIKGTNFSDTVYFEIPTGSSGAFGLNQFRIKVDNRNETDELSETNNELGGLTLNITSDDIFPIYPYEFAIVPDQGVTLKASTANPFAPLRTYRIEIDTTELFNSPLLKFDTITQTGGVVKWTPSIIYMDSVVYYWRVGIDGENNYHYSSFIYLADEYPGWNQSHFYQFQKDRYSNLYLDNDRVFKFVENLKEILVRTGTTDQIFNGPLPWDQAAYYLNAGEKHKWNCGNDGFKNGLVLAVFDSASGQPWMSRYADVLNPSSGPYPNPTLGQQSSPVHGNIHCQTRDVEGFDFPTFDPNNGNVGNTFQPRIVNFINSVPDGNYILAYTLNAAWYTGWDPSLIQTFIDLGSEEMADDTSPTALRNNVNIPWAFFAQKGNPSSATERRMSAFNDILEFTATFEAQWNQGTITTPLIGPADEWGSVHWKYHAEEPQSSDEQSIDIIGVTASGAEIPLDSNITALDYFIQQIDASVYPYIRLRFDTRDDSTRTPTQLEYWRVLFKKPPEAALNPAFNFSFTDSIALGEPVQLTMAVENLTEVHMTPLLVKYTLIASGNAPQNEYVRYDSLRAFETMDLGWLFSTDCNCLSDINTLVVEVNPVPQNSTSSQYDQIEQFHFNNIATLQFKLDKDRINPVLDVTFDGVHIIDGDIVSAEPEILIRLNDENKYLLLNDTSLINVFLMDPSGEQTQLHYDGITMRFDSGSHTNNTAQVWLKRIFDVNGEYTLLVQAKDRSRNISGTYGIPQQGIDYRISFKVIRESMITNVLNYPNPFTSSTRFVFTVTGVKPPDVFKIQIMTVSGKIVRELTQAELGPIHIGNNLTEYAWDGTDEYGDPLANGIYLYRVVAYVDGQKIGGWDSDIASRPDKGTEKYFDKGWGKMYLAR